MLIESPRITDADRVIWNELFESDQIWTVKQSKIDQSLEALREFSKWNCYLGTSWGKDSVVCLHLCLTNGIKVPVVNLRIHPTRNPYCDAVRDVFLSRFDCDYYEVDVDYSQALSEWFSITWGKETYAYWDAAWRSVESQFGDRHISGVRAIESGKRELRMRSFGLNSPNTCAPLGWWTSEDVFSYLAKHDLPTHPNYAMNGGGRYPRNRIRVAEIGDYVASGAGRRQWETEYYGDIMRRILAGKF